ncbi:MAG: hypothetical protein QOF12_1252, partial [Solirubrobacteraceae bacterium]|nr:hypothetical protein [Solirubrobacteraceae bacterium]
MKRLTLSALAAGALAAASLLTTLAPAASAAPARTRFPAVLSGSAQGRPDLGRASSLEPVDVLIALR